MDAGSRRGRAVVPSTAMRHRPALAVALLGAAFLTASCDAPSDPTAEQTEERAAPIVNGETDAGHPYAVALTVGGQPFCSGTVISPTVILTAAHCIFPGIGVDPPEDIEIFFGTDVFGAGESIPVIEGKYFPTFDVDSPAADNDVAMLRLARPAPVAPIRMGKAPTNGKEVTLIGFGITSSGGSGSGLKRVTTATVDLLGLKTFQMELQPGGTCNGDSGGTAIFTEPDGMDSVVGIHTRSDCETFMLDERVDKHIDAFIQPFVDEDASCAKDFGCAKGCAQPDPDCPCADDGFCLSPSEPGTCPVPTDDPDCGDDPCAENGLCDPACVAVDPDCPVCTADGACNPACVEGADPDCGAGGAGGATATSTGAAGGPPETVTECDCRAGAAPPGSVVALVPLAAAVAALGRRRRRRA